MPRRQPDHATAAVMDADPRGLLTAAAAAEYLGVRVQTLAVWRSSNRYPDLRYLKVGRAVRYRRSDLDEWLRLRASDGPGAGEAR